MGILGLLNSQESSDETIWSLLREPKIKGSEAPPPQLFEWRGEASYRRKRREGSLGWSQSGAQNHGRS